MDELTRAAVDRRPRLTETRLRELEVAFAQHWIKEPRALDGLALVEELRRARNALITVGHRTAIQLAARGDPGRGEGADDLHHMLDTVAEGLGVAPTPLPPAPYLQPLPPAPPAPTAGERAPASAAGED
jgi:hypothetical protein